MSLRQPIICCACGVEVDRKSVIRMFDFECCSNTCIEPLRKQYQAEELEKQKERDEKRPRTGAFGLGGSGII